MRRVLYEGKRIRQKLLAMSDVERSQTYEFANAPPTPVQNYRATLRIMPVVDGDRARTCVNFHHSTKRREACCVLS